MDILSRQLTIAIPDAGLKCNSVYGNTSLYTVPSELSLCVTLQMTQEEYDAFTNYINILGHYGGTNGFMLYKRQGAWLNGFTISYKNSALVEDQLTKLVTFEPVMSTILDGKPHKLVCCIGDMTGNIPSGYSGVSRHLV